MVRQEKRAGQSSSSSNKRLFPEAAHANTEQTSRTCFRTEQNSRSLGALRSWETTGGEKIVLYQPYCS